MHRQTITVLNASFLVGVPWLQGH